MNEELKSQVIFDNGKFIVNIYNEEGEIVETASTIRQEAILTVIDSLKKKIWDKHKKINIIEDEKVVSTKGEMRNENGESVRVMDGLFKTDHNSTNHYEKEAKMFLQAFNAVKDDFEVSTISKLSYGALNWLKKSINYNNSLIDKLVNDNLKLSSKQEEYYSSLKYNETILSGLKSDFKEIEENYNLNAQSYDGKLWDWENNDFSGKGESPIQKMFREEQEKRKKQK